MLTVRLHLETDRLQRLQGGYKRASENRLQAQAVFWYKGERMFYFFAARSAAFLPDTSPEYRAKVSAWPGYL